SYIIVNSPLSHDVSVRIMVLILLAMRMALTRLILHRDLKPQNFLLTSNVVAKVKDICKSLSFYVTSL
ncbi:serine/threonine protein kinase, partial [Streptococcus suis]